MPEDKNKMILTRIRRRCKFHYYVAPSTMCISPRIAYGSQILYVYRKFQSERAFNDESAKIYRLISHQRNVRELCGKKRVPFGKYLK